MRKKKGDKVTKSEIHYSNTKRKILFKNLNKFYYASQCFNIQNSMIKVAESC